MKSNELKNLSTGDVLRTIEELQAIQKRNRPTSKEWLDASAKLKPLFREMAIRSGQTVRA